MSKSEDYLDHLLNGMSDTDGMNDEDSNTAQNGAKSTAEYSKDMDLDSFADEMLGSNEADDFLKNFEQELMGDTAKTTQPAENGDDLDSLISGMKNLMQTEPEHSMDDVTPMETMDDLMVNTMDEEPLGKMADEPESNDDDLMTLLNADSDFSDIGTMLQADESNTSLGDESLFDDFAEASMSQAEDARNSMNEEVSENPEESVTLDMEEKGKKKKKEKKEKQKKEGSFFDKLGKLLFGEEEEEETEKVSVAPVVTSIEELSDENLQLLKEFGEVPAPEPEPVEEEKPKKEKKKKEKKEKKPKQAKAPKPKKVKKPKPPKEPDHTPPLPKVPVILTFVMAASLVALVLLGTNLLGYANSFSGAKSAYEQANYSEAFQQVSGMEVKEGDQELYEKYRIMALVSGEYEAYESLMQAGFYDMALDSLVRAAGRSDKYYEDAKVYGCAGEMDKMSAQIMDELMNSFGVSKEEALELYSLRDRKDYTASIYDILEKTGLEKVTEE